MDVERRNRQISCFVTHGEYDRRLDMTLTDEEVTRLEQSKGRDEALQKCKEIGATVAEYFPEIAQGQLSTITPHEVTVSDGEHLALYGGIHMGARDEYYSREEVSSSKESSR